MRHSLCLCDISTPPAETPAAPPTPPSCRPFFDPLIDRSSLFTRVARSQFKCCPPSSFLSASYIMLLGVIMDTCVRHPPSLYLSHHTSWQQLCHTRPRAVLRRHSHTVHSMMNGLISGCGNVPLSLSLALPFLLHRPFSRMFICSVCIDRLPFCVGVFICSAQ